MNPAIYLCLLLPFFLLLLQEDKQKKVLRKQQASKKKRKGTAPMTELINRYIGKECLLYTMNSQVSGVIREAGEGWVSIENGESAEIINLDYIIRIREYPRKKNGKKKSAVLD